MPFKLNVRCHGIFACVEATEGDQVAVLFCQAGRDVVNDQVAYVRFPADSYSQGNKRQALPRPPEEGLQHVVLAAERLTIVADAASHHQRLRIFKERDPRRSETPTKYDARSLAWMPDLDYLSGGQGAIRPEYFTQPLLTIPRLLTRIDFTQGVLGTSGVDSVQVPFRRRDSVKDPRVERHPIARELLLELDIEGDSFTLRAEGLDGTYDKDKDMRFEPKGDLEIVIGSEARADIFTRTSPIEPMDVVAGKCMAEFSLYFNMCAEPPENPLLPFLAARPGSETCCSGVKPPPSSLVKAPSTAREQVQEAQALLPWTALTYLAADNDLSTTALRHLDQLETGDPARIGVVAQIDRIGVETERLLLGQTGFARTTFPNTNSGEVGVLVNFLREGQLARPAEKTAVFFPTHGTGLLDFVFKEVRQRGETDLRRVKEIFRDTSWIHTSTGKRKYMDMASGPDVSSRDFIDNQELVQALRAALKPNERFAIVGFDACVMALVEIAYQVRLAGEYFVASQDDIRSDGWPYTNILNRLSGNPSAADAAKAIVEEFDAFVPASDEFATLSAVDLDALPSLVEALDRLGEVLLPLVPQQIDALAEARNNARFFSTFHYVDLYGFVEGIRSSLGQSRPVQTAADAVLKALKRAVILTNSASAANRAHGLSVYLPNSPVSPEYEELLMSRDAKKWRQFVVAYTTYR